MTNPLLSSEDLALGSLLAVWPSAAFLLDADATVLAHSEGETALRGWIPSDARGSDFFLDVVPGGEVPELGGAFHAAMGDADLPLDIDIEWRLGVEDRSLDVRIRLRKVVSHGQAFCIALIEDNTRLKTAERALAAAMGEAHDPQQRDPITGLFGRRQFDFVLPIELRRAQRYGFGTTLMVLDLCVVLPRPAESREPELAWSAGAAPGRPLDDADLRVVGVFVCSLLRQSDACFRFEPSRFHLVLTHTDARGAAGAAERLRKALAEHHFIGASRRLAVRIASATLEPGQGAMNYLAHAQSMLAEVVSRLGSA